MPTEFEEGDYLEMDLSEYAYDIAPPIENRIDMMRPEYGPVMLWFSTAPFASDERKGPVGRVRNRKFPTVGDAIRGIIEREGQHDFHEPKLTDVSNRRIFYPGELAAMVQHIAKSMDGSV